MGDIRSAYLYTRRAALTLAAAAMTAWSQSKKTTESGGGHIDLGAFYEKFGFKAVSGDASKNWLILKPLSRHVRQEHTDFQPGLGQ